MENEEKTYSVWWRKDPMQRLPSRVTAYSLEQAEEIMGSLQAKGWKAWWTLNEE